MTSTKKITQRIKPCTCGCEGRDSWHAATVKRAVTNTVSLAAPIRVRALEGGVWHTVSEIGFYKHPEGVRACGLKVLANGDELGWYAIDFDAADVERTLAAIGF